MEDKEPLNPTYKVGLFSILYKYCLRSPFAMAPLCLCSLAYKEL